MPTMNRCTSTKRRRILFTVAAGALALGVAAPASASSAGSSSASAGAVTAHKGGEAAPATGSAAASRSIKLCVPDPWRDADTERVPAVAGKHGAKGKRAVATKPGGPTKPGEPCTFMVVTDGEPSDGPSGIAWVHRS
ncbi:hypothetical protein [Streptomyces cucumeris]|uniref:hypothetical protein n=1 Tax=Streptomyces cucumeris TaxID=2962890 RepID=UPI003D74395B